MMSDQKIKGSILKSRLEFVRKEFGEAGLSKIMDVRRFPTAETQRRGIAAETSLKL